MKKILLTLSALCVCLSNVLAQPKFEDGKKYAIQCAYYNLGSITLGAYHSVNPILYY